MIPEMYEGQVIPVPVTKEEKAAFLWDMVYPLYAAVPVSRLPFILGEICQARWNVEDGYSLSMKLDEVQLRVYAEGSYSHALTIAAITDSHLWCSWRKGNQTHGNSYRLDKLAGALTDLKMRLAPNGLRMLLNSIEENR